MFLFVLAVWLWNVWLCALMLRAYTALKIMDDEDIPPVEPVDVNKVD